MRKFPIQLTKAEMRLLNNLLERYIEGVPLSDESVKPARRILFVLREKEL